jgi:hypothetical protein
MPQKVYLWILKIGAILSFLCVFFVFKGLLFPYITSKQIPFNMLMEFLLIFWLAFIVKFPQWSPFRGITKTWPISLFFKAKKVEIAEQEVLPPARNDQKNKAIEASPAVPEISKASHYITLGMALFFVIITISCFTGVDFHMSFWSNAERMLGVFHIFISLFCI